MWGSRGFRRHKHFYFSSYHIKGSLFSLPFQRLSKVVTLREVAKVPQHKALSTFTRRRCCLKGIVQEISQPYHTELQSIKNLYRKAAAFLGPAVKESLSSKSEASLEEGCSSGTARFLAGLMGPKSSSKPELLRILFFPIACVHVGDDHVFGAP